MKKTTIENPVVWFTSATYKCEGDVCKLLTLAAKKHDSAELDIAKAIKAALRENVPAQVFDHWMFKSGVKWRRHYLRIYAALLRNEKIAAAFIGGTMTLHAIANDIRKPRPYSKEAIGRDYIHRLAVWVWRTGADLEIVLQEVRDEYARIESERIEEFEPNKC